MVKLFCLQSMYFPEVSGGVLIGDTLFSVPVQMVCKSRPLSGEIWP